MKFYQLWRHTQWLCAIWLYKWAFSELLEDVGFESKTDSLFASCGSLLYPIAKNFGFGVLRHFYAHIFWGFENAYFRRRSRENTDFQNLKKYFVYLFKMTNQ